MSVEGLTYHTFDLKKKRLRDAEQEHAAARDDLQEAKNKIRDLGLNPHSFTGPELAEALQRARPAKKNPPAPPPSNPGGG